MANIEMLKQILDDPVTTQHFITAKDIFENTVVHYLAMIDNMKLMNVVINKVKADSDFAVNMAKLWT